MKPIKFLFALAVLLLTIGVGCTKYTTSQTSKETALDKNNCVTEGQRPTAGANCCVGLEVVAVDNAFEVCEKPGTGYIPKACMAEGETPFIDTPTCCTGLEPILKGDKYICLP